MLKGTKSISLSFNSMIGDQPVVYMSAQIPESGRSNSSKTIQDLTLYEANKAECRADMETFDAMLWDLEDQSKEPEAPADTEQTSETEGMEE